MAESIDNMKDLTSNTAALSVTDAIEAKFRIGEFSFSLSAEELTKIPYLQAIAGTNNFMEKPDKDGVISLNESCCNPQLMQAIIKYIRTDRARCLFTALPANSNVCKLFELLEYLCIEKPEYSLDALDAKLKNLVSIQDKYGNYYDRSDRPRARDACVKLCWIGRDIVGPKEQSKLYNIVLFVVSHPRTFYLKLRQFTLQWYLQYFEVTHKQRTILQGWLDRCGDDRFSEDDETSSGGSVDESFDYDDSSEFSD